MPAHQHCDLFYPPSWGCDWVYHKLGHAPILQSWTGCWVLSGSSGVRHRLSPVIGWVFETQTNKQTKGKPKQKKDNGGGGGNILKVKVVRFRVDQNTETVILRVFLFFGYVTKQ